MSTRAFNEGFYASGYWRRWSGAQVWLDGRIRLSIFQRWLASAPADRLLDLAGGAGNYSDRLSSQVDRAVLCDIAFEALRQNTNPHLNKVQADLMSLPFRSASFSRVLLADVLEHLRTADLPHALAEAHRICGPGGIIVVFTNCRGLRLRPLLLRLRGRKGRGELDWKDLQDGHLNRLSDRELMTLVGAAGFRVRRKRFFSHVFEPLITAALDLFRSPPAHRPAGPTDAPPRRRRLLTRAVLAILTAVMALDLVLLGNVPGGGVFLALERPE